MFIFGTIIAYNVKIITMVSDHQHDIGVKGQGQIYLILSSEFHLYTSFVLYILFICLLYVQSIQLNMFKPIAIILKSISIYFVTRSWLYRFNMGIHICHNNCLWCVDYNEGFRCDFLKGHGHT